MLAVVATLFVHGGRGEEFEAAFNAMALNVRANEPGCLLYQLARSREEANVYKVLEIYRDQAHFEQHGQTEYFKAGYPKLAACYSARPAVEFLDALG